MIISLVWTKLLAFINSEPGQRIVTQTADVLALLNKSGAVAAFVSLLGKAVDTHKSEGDDMDTNVTDQLNTTLDAIKNGTPVMAIITILTAAFTFLQNKIIQ